jgi:hypothetical protein
MKTIIEMAREANVYCTTRQPTLDAMLERFAELVRADERKACAKQLDALGCDHCAAAIREMGHDWDDTITSIKEALAQPAQEPVAWVGLTDEELFEIMDKANTRYQAVQMTQAKLRELNAPQIDPNQWAFDNGLEST